MPFHFAFAAVVLLSPPVTEKSGLPIGKNQELSTDVRLVESADSVRFEFIGPESVAPSVAIDVNRNGVVDRNVDFQISVDLDGSSCLQDLLHEGATSICKRPGSKSTISQTRSGPHMVTTIAFRKDVISGDGFGFGFAVNLFSKTGNFGVLVGSGDYRFGGKLSLVEHGPNFKGERDYQVPAEILPAIHRYEGCLSRSLKSLEPLDRTRVGEIRAIPAGCAADRAVALKEGVEALVKAGTGKEQAAKGMDAILNQMSLGIGRMAELVENGGRAR